MNRRSGRASKRLTFSFCKGTAMNTARWMIGLALAASASVVLAAALRAQAQTGDPRPVQPQWTVSKMMQDRIDGLPEGIISRMEDALPRKPVAKPAKVRKLLVFVGVKGFYHDSIPVIAVALKRMGSVTEAWETRVTDDERIFDGENLWKFDGVFMNNNCGEFPSSDKAEGGADRQAVARQNFSDYIKAGHGLMGAHAAADCSHSWPEYQDMIGGEFVGHPWQKAAVRNEDPESPINAMFKGKGFVIQEEIYTFKPVSEKRPEGYSRDKVHVLLSVDMEKSDYKDTTRKDRDYALAWTKEYGKGRVFYCAFGHSKELFCNPLVLQHYLAGIQYALGDLDADATPSAKLPKTWKMGEAPDINDRDAVGNINVK